jgi:hypothetical protein
MDCTPRPNAEQRGLHYTKLMSFMACHRASGATAVYLTERWHCPTYGRRRSRLEPARLHVRPAITPRQTKTLPNAPKLMMPELGTTQRRLPPANKKSAYTAAAPRKRRVFTASEGVCADAPALSDQAT